MIYADGGFFRVDALSGRAARIPFTASVEQIVTHAIRFRQHLGGDRVQVRQIAWPSRSPDRKSIVFAALGRIWRYDVAAREAKALTPSKLRASSPAWSSDGRWVLFHAFKGWTRSDLYLLDRHAPERGLRVVTEGEHGLTDGFAREDGIWLRTNLDAPNYRVVHADLDAPGRDRWRTIVPGNATSGHRAARRRRHRR